MFVCTSILRILTVYSWERHVHNKKLQVMMSHICKLKLTVKIDKTIKKAYGKEIIEFNWKPLTGASQGYYQPINQPVFLPHYNFINVY